MEHPLVIDPADPFVERVRAICLAYPEAAEVTAWGRPTFRAGKKLFVMVSSSMDRPYTIVFKPDDADRPALLQDARFFSPPYWGPSGWLAIEPGPVQKSADSELADWAQIAELIDASYRLIALKRQLAALDASPVRPLV